MIKFFKISCEEANHICNKAQYEEATFSEQLKLKWHLLICKVCALYSKQNSLLTQVYKSKANDIKAEKFCLNDKDKELLKEQLKNIH